jgi:quercetin dioxygenase-like cupin family protein
VRTRLLTPFLSLLAAAVLVGGAAGPVVAQEAEASPAASSAPSPAIVESIEERAAEQQAAREERKAERAAQRDERKVRRAADRAERKVRAAIVKESKASAREERKAARQEHRGSWREAKAACRDELAAVREQEWTDKAERSVAWAEAKTACKAAFVTVVSDDAPVDELYTNAADASGVVRTDLGIAEPGSAPGQELGLWHYAISAGEELAPHTHPGWQLARITAGELEYSVLEGEGVLLRADGSQETMGPGTYVLATGDGVIENPALIHYGANRGDEVVTLISATLFEAGEPIASLVEEATAE